LCRSFLRGLLFKARLQFLEAHPEVRDALVGAPEFMRFPVSSPRPAAAARAMQIHHRQIVRRHRLTLRVLVIVGLPPTFAEGDSA